MQGVTSLPVHGRGEGLVYTCVECYTFPHPKPYLYGILECGNEIIPPLHSPSGVLEVYIRRL